jgi:thiol-disulfide isomerase/thioredoxin
MTRTFKLIACVAAFAVALAVALSLHHHLPPSASNTTSLAALPTSDAGASSDSDTRAGSSLIAAKDAMQAPAFAEGTWINSDPLTLESLRGRVVVVDFWTFACFNCRNTLPALKHLQDAYAARGLSIVGVHTPELEREHVVENVRREVASLGIAYAILTDNDYATWNAYRVEAWPTVFILDRAGRVRYQHVGEGDYDVQERAVKTLLAEDYKGETEKTPTSATYAREQ